MAKKLLIVTAASGLYANTYSQPSSTSNPRIGNAFPAGTRLESDYQIITSEGVPYADILIPNRPGVHGWVRMAEKDNVTKYVEAFPIIGDSGSEWAVIISDGLRYFADVIGAAIRYLADALRK